MATGTVTFFQPNADGKFYGFIRDDSDASGGKESRLYFDGRSLACEQDDVFEVLGARVTFDLGGNGTKIFARNVSGIAPEIETGQILRTGRTERGTYAILKAYGSTTFYTDRRFTANIDELKRDDHVRFEKTMVSSGKPAARNVEVINND